MSEAGGAGPALTKTCSVCAATKELCQFYRQRGGRYGVHSQCKSCSRERSRLGMAEWRERNPEAERARCRAWAKANPETKRAQRRRWAAANKDKVAAKARRDRALHPEKFRDRGRRYRAANPDKLKHHAHAARARRRNAPGRGVTASQWRECVRAHAGRCAYCGQKARVQMDHIVPLSSGGRHDPDNITTACATCNRSKGDRPVVVWLFWRSSP